MSQPNAIQRVTVMRTMGQIAAMSGAEAKALLVMLTYADNATGEAFPSMETLATDIGCTNVNRARQAIRRLEDRGCMSTVKPSNGYRPAVRRIDTPKEPGRKASRSKSVPDGKRPNTRTVLIPNPDGFDPNTRTESVPRTTQELLIGTTHELPKGRNRFDPLAVTLPKELDSEACRVAWAEWVQHRKDIAKKLTPGAVKKQLAIMAEWGEARSIAAINHSIASGYTGLYEPKGQNQNGKSNTTNSQRPRHAGIHEGLTL